MGTTATSQIADSWSGNGASTHGMLACRNKERSSTQTTPNRDRRKAEQIWDAYAACALLSQQASRLDNPVNEKICRSSMRQSVTSVRELLVVELLGHLSNPPDTFRRFVDHRDR